MFKALLVDDDEGVRSMLAQFLERDGFSVTTASSAAEGTALLVCQRVDVVITDLRMESPLAGFDVVRAAAHAEPRPLIVILTAYPVPHSEWRNAGADALFVKGMHSYALPKQLKTLLAGRAASC